MTTNGIEVFHNKKIGSYINTHARIYIQEDSTGITYEYIIPLVFIIEKFETNQNIYSVNTISSGIINYSLAYHNCITNTISLNGEIQINVNFGSTTSPVVLDDLVKIKGEIFFTNDNDILINFDGRIKDNNIEYTICSKEKYKRQC